MGSPDHKILQPPPGFMKRGFVETSQGMKIVPIQKQTNPITNSGANDNSKKKKKPSNKKKTQEKSVVVTYYGERLTLSMGVDAKDN